MVRHGAELRAAAALLALTLAACAAPRTTAPIDPGQRIGAVPSELTAVPFFPQQAHQCGPAALATLLGAAGVPATPAALARQVYLPGRRGSLQAELIAATRTHDRLPYLIEPRLEALAAEIAAGRPVLVLQNLALRRWPRWHYAVVVGVTPERIVLRSGRHARLEMSHARFERTWRLADRWAFVALRAGELPARPEPGRWLRSTAAVEELGRIALARDNYALATRLWPQVALAWLALGNAEYRLGRHAEAERAYRAALARDPRDAIAHHNLAQVLLERGCRDDAAAHLEQARAAAAASLHGPLEATTRALAAAAAAGGGHSGGCRPGQP